MDLKKGDIARIKDSRIFIDEIRGKRCEIIKRSINKSNFFHVKMLEGELRGNIFVIRNKHLELEIPVWSVS